MANELDQVSGVEGILDINKRRQQYLDDLELKKQNAQSEFDSYARDTSGEPLDMSRVEQYKDQVEPWRFEQSLYKLQEDHFNARTPEAANANMRFTPVLDKYLLDNPEAFVNLDAKQNRDANLAWADREEAHHYPVFSGDMRGEFKDLNDDDYQVYAVAGYISESSDLGFNDVVDNIDIFASKYAAENNLTSPDVSAVFSHIKGNLTERKTARDTDKANWQNGISSVLNGLSANEALANSVDDKGGKVTTAARSSLMNEFGNELPKAKEIFERFAAGSDKSERFIQKMEGTRDVIGMFEGIFSAVETPKQMKDAVTELVLMPQEQRRRTLALMWMMAEDQAGELEAGVAGKVGESFMRGLDSYVKNIDDAVDSSVEGLARDADLTRAKREMHQDLRDIREVVAEIKSDSKFMQGVYDSARSLPYMISAAIPYGGLALNAASMATDNDIQLRRLYPDMDESLRWKLSLADGTVKSGIERLSFRTWVKGFPSASRLLAGKGLISKVGIAGVRGAGIIATENLEEALQSRSLQAMQSIWGAFTDDMPDVSEEHKESMFWVDERTFFATLPLAVLGAGTKTTLDAIGASQANEMLSDVDRVMLHGFSEQEAKAIAGESDSMKKWLMFKEGSDAKTKEERKEMSEKAVEDGALDRVLEKDEAQAFEAYERDINENGTEEDKVKLEVQTMSREYSKKYDAQIEQEGEQFKVVFPEGKPTQTYETKEEADSAVQAHHVEVNENYLEALSSASANVQAMALQKTVLEKKQEGAKVEVGVPIVGLKEFAEKSDANMKQALERIEHELLKTGEVRPATKADLEKWRTRGQVKLKKDARGYVAQLTEGANIADLVEEGSEGFMRDLVDNGMIEEKWVKEQIIRYQEETGNRITTAESVDQMTYHQMVEAFSDMAVANFYNAHQQDKTGKLGAIINALRIFFAKVAKLAEELMILQKEGKIDADFQTLLDNSVGLNMDDQIARQTEEAQRDILGDATSMSISDKGYKDRIGEDQGKPLTETEIREGVEDESGTVADVEIDGDRLAEIGFEGDESSFSLAPEWKTLKPEDVKGKRLFGFYADRMRVGTYTGLNPESGISIAMQGGIDYPLAHEGAAWAVSSDSMHSSLVNAADERDGIALVLAYQTGNITGNETFAAAYIEELKWAIKSKKISKTAALKILNQVRKESVSLYETHQRREQRLENAKAEKAGREPLKKALAPWAIQNKSNWKTVEDFYESLTNKGATFDSRGAKMFKTSTNVKGLITAQKLGANANVKQGMPDITRMVQMMEVEGSGDISTGDVLGLVSIDKGQAGKPVSAEELGVEPHRSYPKIIKGKPYGKLPKKTNILDIFDPRKGAIPLAGEVLKFKDEGRVAELEDVSFSISPAQDAAYMDAVESGDVETQQRMVDEAAKRAGYDQKGLHSTWIGSNEKPFDVFNFKKKPSLKTAVSDWGVFFTPNHDVTPTQDMYAFMAGQNKVGGKARHIKAWLQMSNPKEVAREDFYRFMDWGSLDTQEYKSLAQAKKAATAYKNEAIEQGYDGFIIGGSEVVVFSPNQIKSADPVTKDADGNVIPLSQRFDAGRDEISMSLAPAGDTVMDKINALMRDPDTRIEIYKDMASRLLKIRDKINKGIGTTDMVAQNISQLEAVMSVLPPEIRYAAGKASKMAKYKTTESALKYLKQRLDRVDTALEGYLRKEKRAKVQKLIKASQPKGKQKASDTGQSKLGDQVLTITDEDGNVELRYIGHKIAKAAKEASTITPERAAIKAHEERARIDDIDDPSPEDIQEHEDVAYAYELFADIKNADSNRLDTMLKFLNTNWAEGRKQWRGVLAERKAWKESKVSSILKGLGKTNRSDAEANRSAGKKFNQWRKRVGREMISAYNLFDLIRENMEGVDADTVKEFEDDVRRASNAYDWKQLDNKRELQEVFVKIFGLKGANKIARAQSRITKLSKGVEWGNRVTISEQVDYTIKANSKELEAADLKLRENPDQNTVTIRDKQVSRSEFDEFYDAYFENIEAKELEGSPFNTKRGVFSYTFKRNTDVRVTVGEMSQLDLMKDWLAVQQFDLKDKYERSGYDEQYRSELDEAIDDDVKELGMWLVNKLREMTPETDTLHRQQYGIAMSLIDNYFPAVFTHGGKQDTVLSFDGVELGAISTRPAFQKSRVNHNATPKRQNALHVFNHHMMQQAFWSTHAEVLEKWMPVMRDMRVQDAIKRTGGESFLKTINNRLEDIETQGASLAKVQIESDHLTRVLLKGMALGILGAKLSTILKNLAAGFNVFLGVEAKYLIQGLRPELFKDVKTLYQSETFQRRLLMGATVASRYALEGGKTGNIVFTTATRAAEFGVQGINLADTGINLTMALAYRAKIVELKKQGVSDEKAKAQALDHVDDLMARFAQPADRLSKSANELARKPAEQLIVMFQSEARKIMAINALAIRKLATGKGVQSKSLAAQQLIVQAVLVNGFIYTVSALYAALFKDYGEGDDAEDRFLKEMTDGKKIAGSIIADSLSGVPLYGEMWNYSIRSLAGDKTFTSTANPTVRMAEGGKRLATRLMSDGWEDLPVSEKTDAIIMGIQNMASIMPQTAILSQGANAARDSLGFMNNALNKGFNKEDTYKLYEKRIKKVVSSVNKDTKDEMKKAKDEKDRRMIRSIETQRKEEILGRTRDILLEMKEADRKEFLKQQKDSEKGIQKYIINDARSL